MSRAGRKRKHESKRNPDGSTVRKERVGDIRETVISQRAKLTDPRHGTVVGRLILEGYLDRDRHQDAADRYARVMSDWRAIWEVPSDNPKAIDLSASHGRHREKSEEQIAIIKMKYQGMLDCLFLPVGSLRYYTAAETAIVQNIMPGDTIRYYERNELKAALNLLHSHFFHGG